MSDHEDDGPGDLPAVGYGRPPVSKQFRPGQSGNPKGRPKGARSLATVIATTLAERVTITENGSKRRITKLDATVKQLVNRAASGDNRSMQLLLALVRSAEANSPPLDAGKPTEADEIILKELQRRFAKAST